MLIQHTMSQLKSLKLDGMTRALEEQQIMPACQELTFEDRLSLLVEREITWRDNRRLARLLRQAKLKQAQACMEDIDYRGSRNLDKRLMVTLAGGDWIRRSQNVLLTGFTGCGKTWLACALGNQATARHRSDQRHRTRFQHRSRSRLQSWPPVGGLAGTRARPVQQWWKGAARTHHQGRGRLHPKFAGAGCTSGTQQLEG